jgi:biopolymer transport protein ExbD
MGAQLGSKGVMADMNLTPLIDIVLVVLIIMMVNIPIQVEEMGVKLPSNQEVQTPLDVPAEQLVIAVYEDGSLALNRRLMTEDVLFYETTRRLRPMVVKNVFIDAYPTVPYGRVVDMMDLAREAGASKVGLAKMKDSGPLPANSVAPGSMPRGLQIGLATVVGARSQRSVDKVITPRLPEFEACYLTLLASKPELSGRIMLRVTVAPDGALMETKIGSSSVEDSALEACVLEIGGTLKYEKIEENLTTIVQYPMLFSPG